LIGRLAVSNKWKGHGIGGHIVTVIIEEALESVKKIGVRLIVVQAKQEAFEFYEKLGFVFVDHPSEDKRFKARGTRTMFFDLKTVMDLAEKVK
jgi:predicted N-acetyltransferase YhbS